MIVCRDVWKRYGRTVALRGVSFQAEAGSLWHVTGPNGAGKSTLLRLAARIALPDRGSVEVTARRSAYVGHRAQLLAGLSVVDNLRYQARLLHLAWSDLCAAAVRFGVDRFWERRPSALSRGMRQRVALARAFAGQPDLLLLDEPETGLDTEGTAHLWAALTEALASGATVLVSTHGGLPAELAAQAQSLKLRGGAAA